MEHIPDHVGCDRISTHLVTLRVAYQLAVFIVSSPVVWESLKSLTLSRRKFSHLSSAVPRFFNICAFTLRGWVSGSKCPSTDTDVRITSAIWSERKYFGSTCSSKISDNDDPLPALWDSVILAVKHLPLTVVPQLIKRSDDGFESCSVVVTKQSFDIFEYKESWRFSPQYSRKVKEERPSGILEATSLSCDAKCLTREATHQDVEVWEFCCVDVRDVSIIVCSLEVPFID